MRRLSIVGSKLSIKWCGKEKKNVKKIVGTNILWIATEMTVLKFGMRVHRGTNM